MVLSSNQIGFDSSLLNITTILLLTFSLLTHFRNDFLSTTRSHPSKSLFFPTNYEQIYKARAPIRNYF